MLRYILTSGRRDRIRFTVAPSGNRVLTLRDFTLPIDCVVDWGDGTKDAVTSNTAVSHTYADGTSRTVEISGALGGFWNAAARAAGTTFVTSVDKIASPSLVTLAETFRECASLASIPTTLDAPNLTACDRCFYNVRRIESDLPALWLTHTQASHANAFSNCFLSRWGKLGSGCNYRQYVSAVAGQTYYQKYGTGCPSRSYVSGTASRTYYQAYSNGANCPSAMKVSADTFFQKYGTSCKNRGQEVSAPGVPTGRYICLISGRSGLTHCGSGCKAKTANDVIRCAQSSASGITTCGSGCKRVYSAGTSGYYSCKVSSSSGTSRCGSGCKRTYSSGQSAYYKCTKGGTCATTGCPWPYANETAYANAKSAGWA